MSAEPFLSDVTTRLKSAREKLGISQAEAARRCAIGPVSWNDLESGKRSATLDRLWGLATALGIDPHELDPRLASAKPLRRR